MYEVDPWLWQFGRGKPRLGGLTVKETVERKKAALDERLKHDAKLAGIARRIRPDSK